MSRNDFGNKPKPLTSSPDGGAGKKMQGSPDKAPMPERTANWGGLPGPPQRQDRSEGVSKVKNAPQRKGL